MPPAPAARQTDADGRARCSARGRGPRPGTLPGLRGACRAPAPATTHPPGSAPARAHRAGRRPALRRPGPPARRGEAAGSGGAEGCRRLALARAELAQQFGGGLVEDAEAGAQRVAGDRLPLLPWCSAAARRAAVRSASSLSSWASSPPAGTGDGRPGADGRRHRRPGQVLGGGGGRRGVRSWRPRPGTRRPRSGRRPSAGPGRGWPQGSAVPAREHHGRPRQPPGDDALLLVALPLPGGHHAGQVDADSHGQDIGPPWPCWAAVSRIWVNDPAPAMAASTVTGSASATASRRRAALTSRPAVRLVPDGPAGRPWPGPASRGYRSARAGLPR